MIHHINTYLMRMASIISTILLFYRIRFLVGIRQFRDQAAISSILLVAGALLYTLSVIILVPKWEMVIQPPIDQAKQILGPAGPLRVATLLHLVVFSVLAIPFAERTWKITIDSAPLIFIQDHFRDPVRVSGIVAFETAIGIAGCEAALWPWIWRPFVLKMGTSEITSLLLLHVLASSVLVGSCLLYAATRLVVSRHDRATSILWVLGLFYYGNLAWVSSQVSWDQNNVEIPLAVKWALICLFKTINGSHDVLLLSLGAAGIAAVIGIAIPILASTIFRIGGDLGST